MVAEEQELYPKEKEGDPKKKAHQLEATIENSVDDFGKATSEISDNIEKKEEALRKELSEANAEIAKLKTELEHGTLELRKTMQGGLGWVVARIDNLEAISYGIAIAFSIIYLAVVLYSGMPLNVQISSPIGVAFALAVAVGYSSRRTKQSLSQQTLTITNYLSDVSTWMSSLAGRKLRTHESFDGIEQGLRSAVSLAKKVLGATKEFNPALKAVYAQATFEFEQGSFVRTLANSLRFYGLHIDSESEKLLSEFESMSNTEAEWLVDISKQLGEKLAVNSPIISLFYYCYVGNMEGARNSWQKTRTSVDEVSQLVRILLTGEPGSYLDGSNPKLVELSIRLLQDQEVFEPRKLDESLRNFHVGLRTFQGSVIQALTHFGVRIDSSQLESMYAFTPRSSNANSWKKEFLSSMSEMFHISTNVIALLIDENAGDSSGAQRSFARIRQEPKELSELVALLAANRILRIPERYKTSADSVLGIITQKASQLHFGSIDSLRIEVSAYFDALDINKQRFLQALSSYNIRIPEPLRDRFEEQYLPPEVDIEGMVQRLAEPLGTRKDFLLLFYFEFVQDEPSLQKQYSEILKKSWTKELAELLIDLGFVEIAADSEKETEADNLSSVLLSFQSFERSGIQSRYQLFRNLLLWSKNLTNFCSEHDLSPRGFQVDFRTLLQLLKGDSRMRSYEQLSTVCREIISKSDLEPKSGGTINASVLSALAVFFEGSGDSRLSEACHTLASNDLASKILYNFLAQTEEALKRTKITLRETIQQVLTDESIKYPYLDDVRAVFSQGRIPQRISDIATIRFERQFKSISELEQKTAEASAMFNEMKASLRSFFETELEKDAVLQLLKSQIVSAYLVTTMSKKAVIGEIIDVWMPMVCEEKSQKDPKFAGILMIDTGGGRHTRIGIVPLGQSFEEFNNSFVEIFREAVWQYCAKNVGENPADFSANIIRIFPVDATFKMVLGDANVDSSFDHPALKIKDLFLSRLTNEENLALVAAARVNDPEGIALRKVIVGLFDGYTSLWTLLRNRIAPIVGTRKQLLEAFESRAVDKQLFQRLDSNSLTSLAQKVYAMSFTPEGKEEGKKLIFDTLSEAMRTLDSRMNESEREVMAGYIFERLSSIGMILSSQ